MSSSGLSLLDGTMLVEQIVNKYIHTSSLVEYLTFPVVKWLCYSAPNTGPMHPDELPPIIIPDGLTNERQQYILVIFPPHWLDTLLPGIQIYPYSMDFWTQDGSTDG